MTFCEALEAAIRKGGEEASLPLSVGVVFKAGGEARVLCPVLISPPVVWLDRVPIPLPIEDILTSAVLITRRSLPTTRSIGLSLPIKSSKPRCLDPSRGLISSFRFS